MSNWFTVKVKYIKQLDNGDLKKVSEPYLLHALSFTDAEARIYEEIGAYIRGDFSITGISKTELNDIFEYDNSNYWYKVKISYSSADDGESGKDKKITQNYLVNANDAKEAFERMHESLKSYMIDFDIPSIMRSPILEIFPPLENLDKEISRTKIETFIEEELPKSKGKVYSAPEDDIEDAVESELEDEFTEENE